MRSRKNFGANIHSATILRGRMTAGTIPFEFARERVTRSAPGMDTWREPLRAQPALMFLRNSADYTVESELRHCRGIILPMGSAHLNSGNSGVRPPELAAC